MTKVLIGNLLESKAQTLVNTVNCVGVMGKGIALEFKNRFPEMFKDYHLRCQRGELRLGQPYLYRSLVPPWVLNFPTKDHWRSVSNLDDIVRGLEYLVEHYKDWGIASLAVPPLGCGQGQLEWRVVGPTLFRYLSRLDVPVEIYAPYGTPCDELKSDFLDGDSAATATRASVAAPDRVRPAWVALVEILHRLEQEPYHWPVGRTTFQKIAYVATREGLPTHLHFTKGSFGPFSPELKGLVTRLVNNGLIHEERLGRMFAVKVGLTFEDARKAYLEDLRRWEPTILKIADLFVRLRSDQSEVVATVLFAADAVAAAAKGKPAECEVLEEVMHWKQRRRPPLNEGEVAYTIRSLAALRYLSVKPSANLPISQEALVDA